MVVCVDKSVLVGVGVWPTGPRLCGEGGGAEDPLRAIITNQGHPLISVFPHQQIPVWTRFCSSRCSAERLENLFVPRVIRLFNLTTPGRNRGRELVHSPSCCFYLMGLYFYCLY